MKRLDILKIDIYDEEKLLSFYNFVKRIISYNDSLDNLIWQSWVTNIYSNIVVFDIK